MCKMQCIILYVLVTILSPCDYKLKKKNDFIVQLVLHKFYRFYRLFLIFKNIWIEFFFFFWTHQTPK